MRAVTIHLAMVSAVLALLAAEGCYVFKNNAAILPGDAPQEITLSGIEQNLRPGGNKNEGD